MDSDQQATLYAELIDIIADEVRTLFEGLDPELWPGEEPGEQEQSDSLSQEQTEDENGAAEQGAAGHSGESGMDDDDYQVEEQSNPLAGCELPEGHSEDSRDTYFCDPLSSGYQPECCPDDEEPPREADDQEEDMDHPPPPPEMPACGAEIAFGIESTLVRVKNAFEELSFLSKLRLCIDPFAMTNWDLDVPKAANPCGGKQNGVDCIESNQVCGRCHDFWDINYILVGLMFRLCSYTYFTAESSTTIWKLGKGQMRDAVFYFLRYGYHSTNSNLCTYIDNNFLGTSSTDAALCTKKCDKELRGPFKTHIPNIQ